MTEPNIPIDESPPIDELQTEDVLEGFLSDEARQRLDNTISRVYNIAETWRPVSEAIQSVVSTAALVEETTRPVREMASRIMESLDPLRSGLQQHIEGQLLYSVGVGVSDTEQANQLNHEIEVIKSITSETIEDRYEKEVYGLFSGAATLSDYDQRVSLYNLASKDVKEQVDSITNRKMPVMSEFIEAIRKDHSSLFASIDSGEITLAELGITPEQEKEQRAHLFQRDMTEIYAFLYELKREKRAYARRKDSNKTAVSTGLFIANDHLTNALARRGENHIRPQDYFSDEPIKVKSGLGGWTELVVSTDADINDVYETYQISDRFRYWADAYYALAFENPGEPIRGTEVLLRNGYSNPYSPSAVSTIEDAAKHLYKGVKTHLWTDVSNEIPLGKKKNAYKRTQAIQSQAIIDGDFTLEEWTDEKGNTYKDFSIVLKGSPEECLPLAHLAAERGQLATAAEDEIAFRTIKKLDTDDRQIWRYILRQSKEKKTSNTIYFSTMWPTLELKEPDYLKPILDKNGNPVMEPVLDKNGNPKKDENGEVKTKPKSQVMTYQKAKDEIRFNPKIDQKEKDRQIAALERKRKIAINSQQNRKLNKLEAMLDEAQSDSGIDAYSKKEITFPKKIKSWKRVEDSKGKWIGIKIIPLDKETGQEKPSNKSS